MKVTKNIELYKPVLEDFWFRSECMSDPKTMKYNAGYDVQYFGYHYDTGCIDFPKERWEDFEEKLKNPNFFYAYIKDIELNKFVGYVNFNLNIESQNATMGIVIKDESRGLGYMRPALNLLCKIAKERGVKCLIDTVPQSREKALKVFYDTGFKRVGTFTTKKYNQDELIIEIEKDLYV